MKQSVWVNQNPLIWLAILVLPQNFQQSFGYHLAVGYVSVGADRIELNDSKKDCCGENREAWKWCCLVNTDINNHKSWQPASSTCSLVSRRSGVSQFQCVHGSFYISSAIFFSTYYSTSLCSRSCVLVFLHTYTVTLLCWSFCSALTWASWCAENIIP